MQQLMRQAQKMQQQMQEAQEQLDAAEYEASSGGGMVSVKVSGKRELTSITIDPQVVDPDDIEMLQDLIMAAVNEALRKGEETRETTMSRMAPGMGSAYAGISAASTRTKVRILFFFIQLTYGYKDMNCSVQSRCFFVPLAKISRNPSIL